MEPQPPPYKSNPGAPDLVSFLLQHSSNSPPKNEQGSWQNSIQRQKSASSPPRPKPGFRQKSQRNSKDAMSGRPTQERIRMLIEARSRSYGEAFNTLSVDGIMSWLSEDIEFNDISMDHYRMNHAATRAFFTTATQSMSSMRILEHSTSGTTPDFVAWEMLTEVTYNVDEPALGIQRGTKALLRGLSLQWWRWKGEGKEWEGDLSEEGIRGWKIVKENDYFVTLKEGAKGARVGLL